MCQQCGYTQSQWAGRCPSCDTWNSLVETVEESQAVKEKGKSSGRLYQLAKVKVDERGRTGTGERELDEVLGGGLVAGMVVLVAGEPGIGKSTLLTQVALKVAAAGRGGVRKSKESVGNVGKVLYVCGEESAGQVALRVKRLGAFGADLRVREGVWLFESTDVDEVVAKGEEVKPVLVVVDSIQILKTEALTGTAGSVGQVRECAQRLVLWAKRAEIPVFLVGHVTKEGSIAGPRVLEHVVDTVLWFEGERSQGLRLVRAVKNRFGPTDEVGVFEMEGKGLVGVSEPSKVLLAERTKGVPGSVVSVVIEGTRPMLVEMQALVVATQLPVPRRVAAGVDMARLQMLVAVLTRRANLHLEGSDIFVNVTGGIKLADRGVDLAICLAIASAFLNRPLEERVAAVGEVGLLGEVRRVGGLDKRIKEAKKLGYRVASAESGKSVEAAIRKLLKN